MPRKLGNGAKQDASKDISLLFCKCNGAICIISALST